jgi:hypothetical protein
VDGARGVDGADGTAAAPVRTIRRGIALARPGTAVRIHPGTYPGGTYVDDLEGTAQAPIWIGGVPGAARPVIEGTAEALHLTRARYVIVHDLEVRGATGNGINADDGGAVDRPGLAAFLLFRDLDIHDIGTGGNQDCLKLSGIHDFQVLDSTFRRCGAGGSAIDHVGCHRGLLARNVIEGGNTGIQAKGGSADLEMRWNTFRDVAERALNLGGSTGFEFFRPPLSTTSENAEARGLRAIANVFVGGGTPFAFVGCVGCSALHNTVIDPERWLMRILQETVSDGTYEFAPTRGGVLQNNLFHFARGTIRTHLNVGAGTAPETFVFASNLWYAHDGPAGSMPALPAPETGGVYGEDAGISGDAPAIPVSSPATGAGSTVAGVQGDIQGRCYGVPPTVGAFEPR